MQATSEIDTSGPGRTCDLVTQSRFRRTGFLRRAVLHGGRGVRALRMQGAERGQGKGRQPQRLPRQALAEGIGTELVAEFETGQLSARYAKAVEKDAGIRSRSSCLHAIAVTTCSTSAKCVAVVEDENLKFNTDGEMDWRSGGYMESAIFSRHTRSRSRISVNGALATSAHKTGHTLGLAHGLKKSDAADTITGADANPNGVDFTKPRDRPGLPKPGIP